MKKMHRKVTADATAAEMGIPLIDSTSSQTIAKPLVSGSYFSTDEFYPVLGRKVEVVTYEGKKFKTKMLSMIIGLRFSISETSFELLSIRDVKEWRYL